MIGGFQQLYLMPCVFGIPGLLLLGVAAGLANYVLRQAGWRIMPA
jgi:hypothetical protein